MLFVDVAGFTAMSERMDPEALSFLMNDCFGLIEAVVLQHGGSIDKFVGDAAMALFGAPAAIERAPRRALEAALEVRQRLAAFNRERGLAKPIGVHVGVNSGDVIAGDLGGVARRDFTVLGDTVNVASRLGDLAGTGQIYVGPTTWLFTRDDFTFRELGSLALKGRAEPVRVYELLGLAERTGLPRLGSATRQITSTMVGREQELAMLREQALAVLDGRGGIVGIVAEAGLGKSRLVAELARLPELSGATMIEARSLPIAANPSFHPFVHLLGGWAGIREGESEAEVERKLEERVDALLGRRSDEVYPFLATMMGLRLEGEHAERVRGIAGDALERLILRSVTELLDRLAETAPLLLFFEDLHWADRSSQKLLEGLLRLATQRPILFLLATRPEQDAASRQLVDIARARFPTHACEITLGPLPEKACDALVRNLLRVDELPQALRAFLRRKAEGNPFYLEEVIRWLIDQGAIELHGEALRATSKLENVVIPGTIREVILTRVDGLPPELQRVLETGAVIGRAFHHLVLREVLGSSDGLEGALAQLKERQLLFERQTHETSAIRRVALRAEREYVFKHALIQETLYESLLAVRRRELHLRVAEAAERVLADRLSDFFGMLAFHFSRAESYAKAEEYLFKAGDEAARSAASSEALHYFREASRMYRMLHGDEGDPQRHALLERSIAMALLNTGNLIESVEHFDRSLALRDVATPITNAARYRSAARHLTAILMRLYPGGGRFGRRRASDEDREILELMYNRARAQSTTDPRRFFFDSMASVHRLNGIDPRTVEQAFAMYAGAAILFAYSGVSFGVGRRFLGVARSLLRPDRVTDLFTYALFKFMCDYFEGRWDEPIEIDAELIAQALRYGRVWDVDTFLGMEAEQLIYLGAFDRVTERIEKLTELIDLFGYDFARSTRHYIRSALALQRGQLEEAAGHAERYYAERPELLLNLLALGVKAKIELRAGRREVARASLEQAEKLLTQIEVPPPYHVGHYHLSRLLHDLLELEERERGGKRGAARDLRRRVAREARAALRTSARMAIHRVETYRLMGRYRWLVGDERRAFEWWTRSVEEGLRLGVAPELARTYREIGERLASSKRPRRLLDMDADGYLARAAEAFAALGLDPERAPSGPAAIASELGRTGGGAA